MSDETPHPAPEGYDSWPAYWQAQGMAWRTEPEIDAERQTYLAERRAVMPDIQRGIYPFRDEHGSITLARADVEWLLATHESGGMRGPVDWRDARQRDREGLDLRGAHLVRQDLYDLPLARMRGGLSSAEVPGISPGVDPGTSREQREMAAAHMQAASFARAHLEGASLRRAHLEGADLTAVHLEGAYLYKARLDGAYLRNAHLEGADLQLAFFDAETALDTIALGDKQHGAVRLVDIHWDGVNLAVVKWPPELVLGDEQKARQREGQEGRVKDQAMRLAEYEAAVRANRQLATVLRNQGMSEQADYFAYRAQLCQRHVLGRQRSWGRWAFSLLLWTLAGYGFRLRRILFSYGVAVAVFAALYYAAGMLLGKPEHLYAWYEAVLVSVTNIHGRIFTGLFTLGTVQAWLAAVEAVVGLVIEGVFIAMLVQRFFAR